MREITDTKQKNEYIFTILMMYEHLLRRDRDIYYKPIEVEFTDLLDKKTKRYIINPSYLEAMKDVENYNKPFTKSELESYKEFEKNIKKMASFNQLPTITEMLNFHKKGKYEIIANAVQSKFNSQNN